LTGLAEMTGYWTARHALAALALLAITPTPGPAHADSSPPQTISVRRRMEATFPVRVVDGRVILGPSRVSPLGTAQPAAGEITVGFEPGGKTPYGNVRLSEKTPVPIDFVAAGLLDPIKIDEIVLCGRLDMPVAQRIAAAALRLSLNQFAVGTGLGGCH
jgi:hypothetical protein